MCASGSGPAGKAIVVPIAEPDGHPVTQGLDDRREIPCVGLVVKDDSSANFRTFPHGVIQGQRIQHSLPDTSVLVIFFDPISIPIVAVAGNLDVEFFQNGFDVIVERTRSSFPSSFNDDRSHRRLISSKDIPLVLRIVSTSQM